MAQNLLQHLKAQTEHLKEEGLYKEERHLSSPQQANIQLEGGKQVINLCANNYLGLSNHPQVVQAAKEGLDRYGFGMSSVRFICGTQTPHTHLEAALSQFLGTEDTILYSSCFDANGGLFETLLGPEDAIFSDALNHASIIDGVRLCKAKRFRYENNNMEDLEHQLQQASDARFKMIATDGVFSMDGIIANLEAICDLAERYNAIVMVDDSHAVGVMGKNGRGSHEYCRVMQRVDILTGTLGKALGGASGGYTSGKKEIITWLRQRSRPYLFSNALAPSIACASLAVLELLQSPEGKALLQRLEDNSTYFREKMTALGFHLAGNGHPIIPVMLGDAHLAKTFADKMLDYGVYVIGFSFPVVPKGQARIRTQMSADHTQKDLDTAIAAFEAVGHALNVL